MMTETDHLLTCLDEELAEVVEQIARVQIRLSKLRRFGPTEVQDGQDRTNAQRLAVELAEVRALAEDLDFRGLIPPSSAAAKRRRLAAFAEYSRRLGLLETPAPTAVDLPPGVPALLRTTVHGPDGVSEVRTGAEATTDGVRLHTVNARPDASVQGYVVDVPPEEARVRACNVHFDSICRALARS